MLRFIGLDFLSKGSGDDLKRALTAYLYYNSLPRFYTVPPGARNLSSDDFQLDDPPDQRNAKSRSHNKPKWVMTQEAFDKLLNAFSADRDEAGKQYERTRLRLCRFFEWKGVGPADELADETLDRVARHLDEGKQIDNLIGYIVGVAKLVYKEALKKRTLIALDDAPENLRKTQPEQVEPDFRQQCFDRCLAELPGEKRYLIVEYYEHDKRHKIKRREKLADELGIPMNALRIRAHRIRMGLENRINEYLKSGTDRND